jgi:hypothetical protein
MLACGQDLVPPIVSLVEPRRSGERATPGWRGVCPVDMLSVPIIQAPEMGVIAVASSTRRRPAPDGASIPVRGGIRRQRSGRSTVP